MDPLDDAFSAMRVRESLYARVDAAAPWAIRFREGKAARFGLVVAGACWLTTEAPAQSIPLVSGDCYVILDGSTYTLGDDPRSPALNCFDVVPRLVDGAVSLGGGGTVVTGWFVYDELGARPLTALLPRVLHTRVDGYRTDILKATLELLAKETERPGVGSGVVISGLADILFVQAIRSHLNNTSKNDVGWLAVRRPHRACDACAARQAGRRLDGGETGCAGEHVALGLRRALQGKAGGSAAGVSDAVAHVPRRRAAAKHAALAGRDRKRGRIRKRRGAQQGFPSRRRHDARAFRKQNGEASANPQERTANRVA
jgi:Cupin